MAKTAKQVAMTAAMAMVKDAESGLAGLIHTDMDEDGIAMIRETVAAFKTGDRDKRRAAVRAFNLTVAEGDLPEAALDRLEDLRESWVAMEKACDLPDEDAKPKATKEPTLSVGNNRNGDPYVALSGVFGLNFNQGLVGLMALAAKMDDIRAGYRAMLGEEPTWEEKAVTIEKRPGVTEVKRAAVASLVVTPKEGKPATLHLGPSASADAVIDWLYS
jgi:hypothetical protein